MVDLHIMHWNINCKGSACTKLASFIDNYIKYYDVLVLTEAILSSELKNKLEKAAYQVFCSELAESRFCNQVIIAVKKNISAVLVAPKIDMQIEEDIDFPNYAQVQIEINNKLYTIIGTRILSEYKQPLRSDKRKRQFQQCWYLRQFIYSQPNLKHNTVILGDFNCGALKGDGKAVYSDVKKFYEYTIKEEQNPLQFYNFHKIKDLFNPDYILEETIGESKSWGLRLNNDGRVNYAGAKLKNDLVLFSKNLKIESRYSWNFVREHESEYISMLNNKQNNCGNPIKSGYPDHAILKVKINL